MPESSEPNPDRTTQVAGIFWPVSAMLGTQGVAVLVFLTVPVMATEIAPAFGVEAKDIGVFISIVFVSAMFFSAASGSLIRRYGGIRANQIGMCFSASCLLLALTSSLPLLFLAAALMGLGYGPNTPSGSHVLARVAPQQARGFVFSLKQSGAPLGGVVAGLLVPTMVAHVGWQGAIMVTVAIAFTTVVAVQPLRSRLDDDRDPSAPIAFSSPWHAVRMVLQHARLRRLILVAFFLTSTQATVMTFLVIFLVQEVKLELALAGAIFACSQAAGALLRVIFGWLSDKALGARPTLVALGIGSSVALVSLALLGPGSPAALVIGLSVAVGALSFGWNGVFLAEVANLAGPTQVGTATGGSLFFLYGGLVFGPIVMSSLITLTGGFTVPFYCVAGPTIIASLNLLRPTPSATSTK